MILFKLRNKDMKVTEFRRLSQLGEKRHIDLKIDCQAFASKEPESQKAKAELAKDICAMANNGSRTSYLLIGVSDNGLHLKSVTNPNLTDDNLQSFCKHSIAPPPKVKLHKCVAPPSAGHGGEQLVAIQIGPNIRHAYRLNQDFISPQNSDPKMRYHFRRNEVWIRREATSDLALPEEIVRLMRREKITEVVDDTEMVDFSRLETSQQLPEMLRQARTFFKELDYVVDDIRSDDPLIAFRVVIPLDSRRLVFRCVAHRALTSQFPMIRAIGLDWEYEHGMFILLMDQTSKQAFPFGTSLNWKEPWGFFSKIAVGEPYFYRTGRRYIKGTRTPTYKELFPLNFKQADLCVVTLARCTSNHRLRERLTEACTFLKSDTNALSTLEESADIIDKGLQSCLREGWIHAIGTVFGEYKLKKGEFKDRRWPHDILARFRNPSLISAARLILRLSNRPASSKAPSARNLRIGRKTTVIQR
jgi:schlafen family protein